jgi:hypothetical protein
LPTRPESRRHVSRETELYPAVKRYLETQGYAVKAEIDGCDVVAVRGAEAPVIVELKIGFTLQLVLQGIDRLAMSDAVYLAVAEPRRGLNSGVVKLCRRLGLGLLTVRGRDVVVLADPLPYAPRRNGRRTAALLGEFTRRVGDPNHGGTSRKPLMTFYRQDALRLARHLAGHGASKASAVAAATSVPRAGAIFRDDVYGWFRRESRGVYGLTDKGELALRQFAADLVLL